MWFVVQRRRGSNTKLKNYLHKLSFYQLGRAKLLSITAQAKKARCRIKIVQLFWHIFTGTAFSAKIISIKQTLFNIVF